MYYDFTYFLEEIWGSGMLLVSLLSNSVGSLLGIAAYVLSSLGFYTIAKRRGIGKAWMAWIPVLKLWVVGCISDQYRYVVKGQVKSRRKALLTLGIIQAALSVAILTMAVVLVIGIIGSAMRGMTEMQMLQSVMTPGIVLLALCLPLSGIAIALAIIYYMAMYDLYTSCAPDNNVLFLVLSIIFTVTEPFFVFFNRNNDKGMPPRRVPQQEE